MRHAKLFGIALLATMVSVGCGQAPTMNADVSGYGGYKYAKKSPSSEVNQVNVISDLNIGHRIDQNIDQEQTGQSNEQSIEQAIVQDGELPLGTNNATQTATNTSGAITQDQSAAQAAAIEGDIEDITIVQSNNIGQRSFSSKKYDRKYRRGYDD